MDAYWSRNGAAPKAFTIDLARRFLAIAKETKCLDDAACERLDEMWRALEDHRLGGLTDKNAALIRQVLTPGSGTGCSTATGNDGECAIAAVACTA